MSALTPGESQVVLLGIPYDASSSYKRGAAEAPAPIRRALAAPSANTFSESFVDTARPDVLTDLGDVEMDQSQPARCREVIESRVGEIVGAGRRPICLGGDHSITYPIVRAVARKYEKLTLLQVDAHPDLYPEFEGDRFSHACPFARIMEEGLVVRLVQVGVRAMTREQEENGRRFGVETMDMRTWSSGRRPTLEGPVYMSIDMDGFDPAFAPGVSHREPGGLTSREVLSLIQTMTGPIVGADIVEFNPREDPIGLTAPLCSKLVKELTARMSE